MKRLQRCLIVFLLILLPLGCREPKQSGPALHNSRDSLSVLIADSLNRNDPWVKYSYPERQGKRLFELYCAVCHGTGGEGDGFNAYNLDPHPHSLSDSTYMRAISNETLAETISFGGKAVNKSVLMPAYHNTLSKSQISDIVSYINTFSRNSPAEVRVK